MYIFVGSKYPDIFYKKNGNEISAFGTGINLPFYNYRQVETLTALDISAGMLAQAKLKLDSILEADRVSLVQGTVEAMPFDSDSFDSVVDTFSLCVYSDPVKALKEMARVVKPGSRLAVSVVVSAVTLFRLPQKLSILAIKRITYRIKVSRKYVM